MSETDEQTTTIELDEEEGAIQELEESLFFKKIGDALPLQSNPFSYPLGDLPTQALAVSENPQALFLAHPKGFYVAKTVDVFEASKLMKEKGNLCSIEELSIVDVQIGSVRIVAVSKDNSTLAASVGENIHFFSIASLLSKDENPLYSCSIDESSYVKDFRWRKKLKGSYLVLSSNGVLYHGELDNPLKKVMENVDAADWSPGGNSVAVVKRNSVTILSSRFRERFTLSIPFNSHTTDTDSIGSIKVDSINWIRQDCVLLGCFQITKDGKEEGYHIQIISSKCGKISEASKAVVLSFEGAFAGINDDLLPFGCGPHLFLNYLEDREVALVANKKNTDEHIILFGWSLDDEHKEALLIELSQDDRWLPKIGLQDNEDDNLIVGFGVDKLSLYEKVEIELGVVRKELSPYCILLCLTIDAKLSLFHVAGVTENPNSPKTVSAFSDEEDRSGVIPSGYGFSKTISSIEEDREDGAVIYAQSLEMSQEKLQKGGADILKNQSTQENDLKDYSKIQLQDDLSNKETCSEFSTPFHSSGKPHANKLKEYLDTPLNVGDVSNKETSKSNISFHSTGENQTNELKDYSKIPSHAGNLFSKEASNKFSKSFHLTDENQDMVQSVTAKKELRPHCDLPPSLEKKDNANDASQSLMSGSLSSNLDKSFEQLPLSGSGSNLKDSRKPEAQKVAPTSSAFMGTSSFTGNIPSISHSKYVGSLGSGKISNELTRNSQSNSLQSASPGSHANYKLSSTNVFNSRLGPTEYRLSPSDNINARVGPTEVGRGEQSGTKVGSIDHVVGNQSPPDLQYGNLLNVKGPNAGTRYSFNTSGMSTPTGEQRASTRVEKFISEPDTRSSHVSSNRGSTSHNPVNYKLQPTQENIKSSQSSYGITSEREFSKHFGNVDEMAKELDTLLSCIEEEGGFKDVCIIFQKNSVSEIENDLEKLMKKCRAWNRKMEEQNEGIEHLLDQTVQVMARKNYIEGVVKQASDSQYWDLWNHQKLTPELELKRRQILKANQDLTNQLIELERHFNTLEINKFSENSVGTARRVMHSGLKSSRDSQAFNRLYNTMSSQLAAAEQLSENLTKQMAALNIEQPSAKRKSVAKELFESIGLDYSGDSFKSPNVKKDLHSPESVKKLPLSSASAAIKEQSRRNPSSVMKSFEPETARRRVSLDRSWASFEPPKTTVKRMLLPEEEPRLTANKLSLVTNKESSQQHSSVAQLRDHKKSSPSLLSHVNKLEANRSEIQANQVGSQDAVSKHASPSLPFKWANDLSGKSNSINMKSSVMQVAQQSNSMPSSFVLGSASTPQGVRSSRNESFGLVSDRSSIGEHYVNKFDQSKGQPIQFSNAISTSQSQSSGSTRTNFFAHAEKQTSPKIPDEISVSAPSSSNKGDIVESKAGFLSGSFGGVNQEKSVTTPPKSHTSPFTHYDSHVVSFPKFSQFGTVAKETHLGVSTVSSPLSLSLASSDLSSSSPLKASVSDSSTSLPITTTSSSSVSLVKSEITVQPSTNVKVQSMSSYSSPSSSITTGVTQAQPMEPKPSGGDLKLKSDINASQALVLQSKPFSAAPAPALTSTPAPAPAPTSTPAPAPAPAPAPMMAPPPPPPSADISPPIVADVKKENPNFAAIQEVDMEEEASDTTTDLSLGSFGGFGLGSAPTSAAPKPNPFGATFQSAVTSATSSPFNFNANSGELFRPASFSHQPTQPSQPATQSTFSSPFTGSEPPRSGFGQPANVGAGNQALGSVLGAFGQSRQLGTSPPGAGFGSTTTFGSGFAASRPSGGFGTPTTGGFANPSTGGFAGVTSTVGGFSGIASGAGGFAGAATGGFAGVASSGSGFSGLASGGGGLGGFSNPQGGSAATAGGVGGGFAGVASSGSGFSGLASGGGGFGGLNNPQGGSAATAGGVGGFGGFSNPQASGFSAFNSPAGTGARPQQFMQMRK